jgi:hypothetical protein
LRNVLHPGSGSGFPNAVICDSGSVIEFIIKSKGPRGCGYTVRSGMESIADALYFCDTSDNPGANRQVLTLPYFYSSKKNPW